MRLASLLALIAAVASAQPRYTTRECSRTPGGRSTRGIPCETGTFFEFAPASGAGMSVACAGTVPTSVSGTAGTFTRASAAECSKAGLASTGIANGDLVLLTANQPRVEPSGGVLGLRHEEARTNSIIRSNEFENAAWLTLGTGVAAPTVTANYGTSPRGTATADRVQLAAATGTNQSLVYQPSNCGTGANKALSVYVRSLSGSGTTALCVNTGTVVCGSCSFVDTSWSRCEFTANVTSNGTWIFGNNSLFTGATYPAYDLLVWGAQCETGTYSTSFIETTSASSSRAVEPGITYTTPDIGPTFCAAASIESLSADVAVANVANGTNADAGATWSLFRQSNTEAGFSIDGTITQPTVSAMGTAVNRLWLSDTTAAQAAKFNAADVSAPANTLDGGVTTIRIGAGVPAVPANGIVSRVQVDPDPTRCTP